MNWYLAKIVYRIICGDGDHTPQFDEQLRLIAASDEAEAFTKAIDIGEREQDAFYNRKEQLVQWKFVQVPELYPLSQLVDGAEIYSRINEVDNAAAYINFVHRRAAAITEKLTRHSLNLI